MKKEFYGILELDYPNISDADHRRIQLGELTKIPGGISVAEYTAKVEELKNERFEAEAKERDAALLAIANPQPNTEEKNKEERTEEDVVVPEPQGVEPPVKGKNPTS